MDDIRSKDDLGDRMKAYEATETGRRPDPRQPIYARIDGRGFSRFTRGMARPFDPRMSLAMVETAKRLVDQTDAKLAYTQSDEISLVWFLAEDAPAESQIFFDGKIQKLVSVLAAYATAAFTKSVLSSLNEPFRAYADRLPHFDCRVFQLPSISEAANAFLWRELDATRNAVQMAAGAKFSPKQLHGKNVRVMREMLREIGVDFEAYPAFFKRGTFLRRVSVERMLTENELARIPEKHRPPVDQAVQRHEIQDLNAPPLLDIEDRETFLFPR